MLNFLVMDLRPFGYDRLALRYLEVSAFFFLSVIHGSGVRLEAPLYSSYMS